MRTLMTGIQWYYCIQVIGDTCKQIVSKNFEYPLESNAILRKMSLWKRLVHISCMEFHVNLMDWDPSDHDK